MDGLNLIHFERFYMNDIPDVEDLILFNSLLLEVDNIDGNISLEFTGRSV